MEMRARRQLLIDALRSGKYQFGRGEMKRKVNEGEMCTFCVAGVMCEEYRLLHPGSSRWLYPTDEFSSTCFYDDRDQFKDDCYYWSRPPDSVLEFFGMPDNDKVAKEDGMNPHMNIDDIIKMNDLERSHNFVEIANFMEFEWGLG